LADTDLHPATEHLIWRLTQLAVPVAFVQLGNVLMGVTDAIVVGQLAPHELAWQQLGWVFNGPAMFGGIGLLLGVQVLAARAIGAGTPSEAGVACARASPSPIRCRRWAP